MRGGGIQDDSNYIHGNLQACRCSEWSIKTRESELVLTLWDFVIHVVPTVG